MQDDACEKKSKRGRTQSTRMIFSCLISSLDQNCLCLVLRKMDWKT